MFNFKKIYPKKNEFESRILNPKNMLLIKNSLGNILPQFKIEHNNVSDHWQALKDVITSVRDRVAPLKKFRQKSEVNLPYYDREMVLLASIRDKSHPSIQVCIHVCIQACIQIKANGTRFFRRINQIL